MCCAINHVGLQQLKIYRSCLKLAGSRLNSSPIDYNMFDTDREIRELIYNFYYVITPE